MTEIWQDSTCLLLPASRLDMRAALEGLRMYPVLSGFRGKQGANHEAILDTIEGVQDCVVAHQAEICEIEINPLICTANEAIAVDALVVRSAAPEPTRKIT